MSKPSKFDARISSHLRQATEPEKTELMDWARLLSSESLAKVASDRATTRGAARFALIQARKDLDHFIVSGKRVADPLREARTLLDLIAVGSVEGFAAHIAAHPPSAGCIAFLLIENTRLHLSASGSNAAKAKNKQAREWVLSEWNKRTDKGQSKASFGRTYAPLVKKRFGLDIGANQIERFWLPRH